MKTARDGGHEMKKSLSKLYCTFLDTNAWNGIEVSELAIGRETRLRFVVWGERACGCSARAIARGRCEREDGAPTLGARRGPLRGRQEARSHLYHTSGRATDQCSRQGDRGGRERNDVRESWSGYGRKLEVGVRALSLSSGKPIAQGARASGVAMLARPRSCRRLLREA